MLDIFIIIMYNIVITVIFDIVIIYNIVIIITIYL